MQKRHPEPYMNTEDGDVFGAVRTQENRTAGQEWAPFWQFLFCLSVTWPAQAEMFQC